MTDTAPADTDPDAGQDAPPPADGDTPPPGDTPPQGDPEAEKWKAMARKHEAEARKARKELEAQRLASMGDSERAIEEARTAARAEALAEVAGERVAAAIAREAAGKLPSESLDAIVGALNPAAFTDDAGVVDTDRVKTFVAGLVPAGQTQAKPDLGQGARGSSAGPVDMNQMIRSRMGR